MWDQVLGGIALAASPAAMLATLGGLALGILVGAIPGLTASITVAILTPVTFFMPPTIGIGLLLGIYKGAVYGGSIPAVLINTPGTPAAAATALDGNVLAKRGEARSALQMSLYASVFGDLFATMILFAVAAPLANFAVKFSSPEYTLLFIGSLTLIATVSGSDPRKGMLAAALGALVGCIGLDPMSGSQRFVFGVSDLMGGITLVPLLIGMFALSEVLDQIGSRQRSVKNATIVETSGSPLRWSQFRQALPTMVRSSGIGAFIGALPGLGAEIACWVCYGVAKRRSKRPELFGKGSLEGVAAAESGNNATVPATLIPMLVFGIPGDVVTAVLLGAFIAQGLTPGPMLFINNGGIIYSLYALLVVTNIALVFFGLAAIRLFARVAEIPAGFVLACVVVMCFAGTYSINSSGFDLAVMVGGGVAGLAMRRTNIPVPPFIIAVLLAPLLESNLRQTLAFSEGSLMIFATRPIAAVLLGMMLAILAFYVGRAALLRRRLSTSH